jgi:hypothetical protein
MRYPGPARVSSQPEIARHTERDRMAEVGCFLGFVTGTPAKLATDVKLMMATQAGEALEPYARVVDRAARCPKSATRWIRKTSSPTRR